MKNILPAPVLFYETALRFCIVQHFSFTENELPDTLERETYFNRMSGLSSRGGLYENESTPDGDIPRPYSQKSDSGRRNQFNRQISSTSGYRGRAYSGTSRASMANSNSNSNSKSTFQHIINKSFSQIRTRFEVKRWMLRPHFPLASSASSSCTLLFRQRRNAAQILQPTSRGTSHACFANYHYVRHCLLAHLAPSAHSRDFVHHRGKYFF